MHWFGCPGAVVYMWRLEDYQWESVLSFTTRVLGIELRSSDLVAALLTAEPSHWLHAILCIKEFELVILAQNE